MIGKPSFLYPNGAILKTYEEEAWKISKSEVELMSRCKYAEVNKKIMLCAGLSRSEIIHERSTAQASRVGPESKNYFTTRHNNFHSHHWHIHHWASDRSLSNGLLDEHTRKFSPKVSFRPTTI